MFSMESLRNGLFQILVDKNNDDWLTFTEEEVAGLLRMLRPEPLEEQAPNGNAQGLSMERANYLKVLRIETSPSYSRPKAQLTELDDEEREGSRRRLCP